MLLALLVAAVFFYITRYNDMAEWQRTLLMLVIVVSIPTFFVTAFSGRIARSYAFDESVLSGEEDGDEEDASGDASGEEPRGKQAK